jgi:hypothetical protein
VSEAEVERIERVESWVLFAVTDTSEAITDVETAIGFASGLTRERLIRVKSALEEAAAHLDTIYPGGLHSVKA